MIPPNSHSDGKPTRMIKIHNVQHVDIWLDNMGISKNKSHYNLYYSLAHYRNGIPNGLLDLGERDFGNWKAEHWKEMDGYDFLLDIDAGNHKEIGFAYYSAKKIKKLFDEFNVPYHLRFSGMGFHFIIPYLYFSTHHFPLSFNPDDDMNIYKYYRKIAEWLYSRYSEMIDLNIYDSRRVVKIPYSLALFKSCNYVCIPFSMSSEFENFNIEYAKPFNYSARICNDKEHLFNENGNLFKLLKEMKIMG